MRNRVNKFNKIKNHLFMLYKELPIELASKDDFLIHLEFYITCLDYDLKPTRAELEQLRKDIINNILKNMEV